MYIKKRPRLVGVKNKIRHSSSWDGTLRTLKAEYIMKVLKPKNAKDLAAKLKRRRNKSAMVMSDKIYPFLYNCKPLVDFVKKNRPDEEDKKYWNYWITAISSIDINADLWKLFPTWKKKYPAKGHTIVMGTKVMKSGWHDSVREFEKEMSRLKPLYK